MKKHVKNLAAFAIVTAAGEVIAPMGTSKEAIDITKRDTAALIARGSLEVVGAKAASGQDSGPLDPAAMKAGQLKAELDKLGVDYAGNASTEVLRDLYIAKLAEQAGQ